MTPTLSGIIGLIVFSIGTVLIALSGDVPSFQLSAITLIVGAITLFGFLHFGKKDMSKAFKAPISSYSIVTMGVGLYVILLNLAFKNGPAFEVNILNYFWPVLLVIFSTIAQKKKFRIHEVIGISLGFAGIYVLFKPEEGSFFESIYAGHFYAIAAAITWALYSALINKREYSVALLVPAMMIAGIASLILHLLLEETVWIQPLNVWLAIAALSVSRFAYAMWDYGIRYGDKVLLASLSYFVPLLSVFYFIAFGFSPARPAAAFGASLIICASLIVNSHRIKMHKKGGK